MPEKERAEKELKKKNPARPFNTRADRADRAANGVRRLEITTNAGQGTIRVGAREGEKPKVYASRHMWNKSNATDVIRSKKNIRVRELKNAFSNKNPKESTVVEKRNGDSRLRAGLQ